MTTDRRTVALVRPLVRPAKRDPKAVNANTELEL